MCSNRFEECVAHLDAALKIQPLVATAWYLRGIACMRLEVSAILSSRSPHFLQLITREIFGTYA